MKHPLSAPTLLLATLSIATACSSARGGLHRAAPADLAPSSPDQGADLATASTDGRAPDSDGGGPIQCTPGQPFCVGGSLYTCTASGADGTFVHDCAAGTPPSFVINSLGCFPDHCGQAAACCRATMPMCVASFSSDVELSFTQWSGQAPNVCGLGTVANYPGFAMFMSSPGATSTTGDSLTVGVPLPPDLIAPGGSASVPELLHAAGLPDHAISMQRNGVSCQSWTGTLYLDSGAPAWQVRLDLTCAESGKSLVKLAGTFNGTY